MPSGRLTVITPAIREKIAEMLFLAFTNDQIAEFTGISAKTIQRARNGDQFPDIRKAALAMEFPYRLKVWNGAGNWCGAAWFLERKYPEQFARPEIQLSLQNNYNHNNLHIHVDNKTAKEIERQAAPVRARVIETFAQYRPDTPVSQIDPPQENTNA